MGLEGRSSKQVYNMAAPSWILSVSLCLLWLPLFPEPGSVALSPWP